MALQFSQPLSSLVRAKYTTAKEHKSLTFAPTKLTIVQACNQEFQLRYCPSLAKKPTESTGGETDSKEKVDPFEDPDEDLLIDHIPHGNPTHLLVLNKYPIIPNHFILATLENKAQTSLLEGDDLWLTYQCLQQWKRGDETEADDDLFAFFNSGEHSGASQPHRHLQLLSQRDMKHDMNSDRWSLLADALVAKSRPSPGTIVDLSSGGKLPFKVFGTSLPEEPSADWIHKIYKQLYDFSAYAVYAHVQRHPRQVEFDDVQDGSLPISYNMAMTTKSIVICPRRSGGETIRRQDGTEIGAVELNGTVLGGTLMVKNEELFSVLKSADQSLEKILAAVGIPL